MTYADAIHYIEGALKFGINPSLERIGAICRILGDPQLTYPTIQITGTNGKTSTTWMVSKLLSVSGLKTGCYTSPHLHSYRERITIDGVLVTEGGFARTLEEILPAIEEVRLEYGELTEFEILTAMAFHYFSRQEVDAAVFEVGLGGRWDATSMVRPRVAAITGISLDHTDRLGDTIEEIAWDKAHIIKSGCTAIIGDVPAGALEKIEERCETLKVPTRIFGKDFGPRDISIIKDEGALFSISGLFSSYDNILLPIFAGYQVANFTMAVAIVEAFTGRKIPLSTVIDSLAGLSCPGRFEVISKKPLIILDGAHNPDGIGMLVRGLPEAFKFKNLFVVLAISSDKDVEQILRLLAGYASLTVLTQNNSYRSASTDQLNDVARYTGNSYIIEPDLEKAIDKAVLQASVEDLVCITGSLYTVADAREILINNHIARKSAART
ncbi:MAG TPA: folylpolyglutamate synthase/dihydrofolate synthase family protein [Anaerolineae bacterium]|nr:folylpolyglutamate synthase/dihydrofolate synthase family protein [Anaerolineae bacterium]